MCLLVGMDSPIKGTADLTPAPAGGEIRGPALVK
jgi:hypothetical protein